MLRYLANEATHTLRINSELHCDALKALGETYWRLRGVRRSLCEAFPKLRERIHAFGGPGACGARVGAQGGVMRDAMPRRPIATDVWMQLL